MCAITVAVFLSTGLIPYNVPFPLLMTHTVAAHVNGESRGFIRHSLRVCFPYFHASNNPAVNIRVQVSLYCDAFIVTCMQYSRRGLWVSKERGGNIYASGCGVDCVSNFSATSLCVSLCLCA